MIYATYARYSRQVPEDKLIGLITHVHNREVLVNLTNGIRLMNGVAKSSIYDGDNFSKYLITVIVEYNGYKIPRFLKKYLLRNFKPSELKMII